MEQLYVVGFLVGCLTLFFDVSYQSYLPSLVEKEQLTDGNGKMEATQATASVLGPTIGGYLVQWFTAPVAVVVDAFSFLWSAAWIASIKKAEPRPEPRGGGRTILKEIKEGVHFVVGSSLLRPIALATGLTNLFAQIMFTPYLLVLTRQMGLNAGQIGLIMGGGSIGAVLGALLGQKLGARFGIGRTVLGSSTISKVTGLLVPAALFLPHPMLWLVVAGFGNGFCGPVYNINQVSLRQAYCPGPMQGRMNASMRTIVWGTIPVGALIGGFLGDSIGFWQTMTIGAVGGALGLLPLIFSQVPAVKSLTELPAAPAVGD
jgi:MFS family permease